MPQAATYNPQIAQEFAKKYGVPVQNVQFDPNNNPAQGGMYSASKDTSNLWGHIGGALAHIPGLGQLNQAMTPGASMGTKFGAFAKSIPDILAAGLIGGPAIAGGVGALGIGGGAAADVAATDAAAAGGSSGPLSGIGNFLKNYVTGQPLGGAGGMGLKQMLKIGARVGIPAAAIYGMFGKKGQGQQAGAAGGATDPQHIQDLLSYAALAQSFMNPYEQQIRQAYQTQASAIKRLLPQLPSQFRGVAGLMEADMAGKSQAIPGLLGQQAAGLPMELLNAAQTNPLGNLPAGSTGTVNIPGMGQVKLPGT